MYFVNRLEIAGSWVLELRTEIHRIWRANSQRDITSLINDYFITEQATFVNKWYNITTMMQCNELISHTNNRKSLH